LFLPPRLGGRCRRRRGSSPTQTFKNIEGKWQNLI
jgi:hypothetical protein